MHSFSYVIFYALIVVTSTRYLFYKEPLFKQPLCRRPKYSKNLYYQRKEPKEISIWKISIIANNQEIGSWFHLFTAATHIYACIKLRSYLLCASWIQNFYDSLCLYHFMALYVRGQLRNYYGTFCARIWWKEVHNIRNYQNQAFS